MFAKYRLGLVLLHERFKGGSSSKWEPYVSNLPKRFKGVPVASFGAVEMRGMQDIVLAGKIDQRQAITPVIDHFGAQAVISKSGCPV